MSHPICSIPDCGRKPIARGWCTKHYQRWSKFGDPLADHSRRRGTCSIEGCEATAEAKALCGKHYQRLIKHGDPLADNTRRRGTCSIDGCDKLAIARSLCKAHYERHRTGTTLATPVRRYFATDDIAERLAFYAPPGDPGECWEWTGSRNKGYGLVAVGGTKMRQAHVVAWQIASGSVLPAGMVIRHSCDNPPCVNPNHLLLGTQADNVQDMVERNRCGRNGPGFKHLTPAQVRNIRRLHKQGIAMAEIARRFGKSRTTISRVVHRKVFTILE